MTTLPPLRIGKHTTTYPTTAIGIDNLLQDLTCLQCRAVLLEWQRNI